MKRRLLIAAACLLLTGCRHNKRVVYQRDNFTDHNVNIEVPDDYTLVGYEWNDGNLVLHFTERRQVHFSCNDMFYCLEEKSVGELKIDKILDAKFINKETGEVMMIYPGEKIIGIDVNLAMVKEDLKEFVGYEPIVAKDDDWG